MQQDVRNCCGQRVVCVGECWAASLFFVRALDGESFFFSRVRSGVAIAGVANVFYVVIRTHDRPKNPYSIPILNSILGPDYCVPP